MRWRGLKAKGPNLVPTIESEPLPADIKRATLKVYQDHLK